MNSQSQIQATSFLKQCWAEVLSQNTASGSINNSINNNDTALIFQAVADLMRSLEKEDEEITEVNLEDEIEQIAREFPVKLAPLCRALAQNCIATLHNTSSYG
jgi:hypothetical protein